MNPIKKARIAAGITTAYQAAKRAGVNYPTYLGWEKGRAKPRPDRYPGLATTFGCTVDALMGVEPAAPQAA